jgi:ATP-dependent Lon protease
MEILELSSYTENEKVAIATHYLIPRQVRENGLRPNEIKFTEDAVRTTIRSYTREAGVRNLERAIGQICRKLVTKIAEGKIKRVKIDSADVAAYMGKQKYFYTEEIEDRTSLPGVATALAWTPVGGDIMFIEATAMPGGRGFQLSGQLGEVMQESARAALSYVRSKAKELHIPADYFTKHDIHLHVPAGGTPKDGPSAGVTMATALVSLITGRPVRSDLAMTGEITLRGQVLPIGGVKEKVVAAHRAGLRTVILPLRNEKDVADVPEEIRQQMKFVFANRVEDVLAAALEKPGKRKRHPKNNATLRNTHKPQKRKTKG